MPYSALLEIDRLILHRFQLLLERVRSAYDTSEYHVFYQSFYQFCVVDLSAFYLDILKDRLYTFPTRSVARRAAQTTLYDLLEAMARLMAPVLSFTAEEVWRALPADKDRAPNVHLASLPEPNVEYLQPDLAARWETLCTVRGEVSKALEQSRRAGQIGHSLDTEVTLYAAAELRGFLERYASDLAAIFIVSGVEVEGEANAPADAVRGEEVQGLRIRVGRAPGKKCERCWMISPTVGESEAYPSVCDRCIRHMDA